LHYHGLVFLKDKPTRVAFAAALKTSEFQQLVCDHLDQLVLKQPPCLTPHGKLSEHRPDSCVHDLKDSKCELVGCEFLHPHPQSMEAPSYEYQFADDHVAFARVHEAKSEQQFWQAANIDLDRLIPAVQTHRQRHGAVCESWQSKRRRAAAKRRGQYVSSRPWLDDPDFVFRFGYAHGPHPKSDVHASGEIRLCRRHHWTNGYNPIVSACLRCNTDVKPLWSTDRKGLAMVHYMCNYSDSETCRKPSPLSKRRLTTLTRRSRDLPCQRIRRKK